MGSVFWLYPNWYSTLGQVPEKYKISLSHDQSQQSYTQKKYKIDPKTLIKKIN